MSLKECIKSLRDSSGKPNKFKGLQSKLQNRFSLTFVIDVGNIGSMEAGFDNHNNHPRPHIHIDTKIQGVNKISIALDNGNLLHDRNKKLDNKTLSKIKDWVLDRKDCLTLIYNNIQKCKDKSDFDPLIDAMERYL